MSTTSADPTLTFRIAYDEALPDILALPAQGLLQVTADIPSVVVRALGSMPQIRALRDQVAQLPFFDLAAFDKLETYARALGRAQVLLTSASQPRAPLPELTERATKIRETLVSDAQSLAHRGMLDGQKLKELKGPVGYKNVALDLLTVAELLRSNYASFAGKTAVTVDELNEAEVLAEQIFQSVGDREEGPQATAKTTEIRQRAYTLFVRTWEQARRAIQYVRYAEGDLEDIAPSLFAGRNTGARKKGEEEAPTTEAPAAPVVAPTNGATHAPAAVGLPGSDPFGRV